MQVNYDMLDLPPDRPLSARKMARHFQTSNTNRTFSPSYHLKSASRFSLGLFRHSERRFAWVWVRHRVRADFADGMGLHQNLSSRKVSDPLRRDCNGFPTKGSESGNVSGNFGRHSTRQGPEGWSGRRGGASLMPIPHYNYAHGSNEPK